MFLADLHIHSTFSDGKLTIPQIVDMYGSKGFGAIAITDHLCEEQGIVGRATRWLGRTLTRASFPIYREILKSEAERAWKTYRMVLIPGFEITKNSFSNHRSAHVLALGTDVLIPADGEILDILRAIRAQGALCIAAHPVSTRQFEAQTYHLWSRRAELAPHIDAWEVASGARLFDEVLRSGLPLVASSDLHHPRQINSWKTVFQCERHPEAILRAVRKQELGFRYYEEDNSYGILGWIAGTPLGPSLGPDSLGNLVT